MKPVRVTEPIGTPLSLLAEWVERTPRTSAGRVEMFNRFSSLRSSLGQSAVDERWRVAASLEKWARECSSAKDAALVWIRAGDLVALDADGRVHAAECYVQALQSDPQQLAALARLTGQLTEAGKPQLLDHVWVRYVENVCASSASGAAERALAWRRLGRMRASVTGHLDGAIEAYERALAEQHDECYVIELAELRNRRAAARPARSSMPAPASTVAALDGDSPADPETPDDSLNASTSHSLSRPLRVNPSWTARLVRSVYRITAGLFGRTSSKSPR